MSHGGPPADPTAEPSLSPTEGWHCSHFYYRFRRDVLRSMDDGLITEGKAKFVKILDKQADDSPAKLQTSMVSGHKADFGLMIMDPDPLLVEGVHQQLMAGPLGPALEATYSFVSMTEVSEYVPTIAQYAQRLLDGGETQDSPAFQAKVRAYEKREPMMRRQRLTPDLPQWSATCFYPMNKKRKVGENWFLLPFSARNSMMAEHARSGMAFAGKVSQLITVAVGLDDWEWGVTLWAKNPEFLKDIVYRMRFDEASTVTPNLARSTPVTWSKPRKC